ncbi:VOC family protein [Croceicoccus bisphenolivorans]|uniref:VOC family protein n=1 Tax=Croceicoccus bisphenolivorans TaxID=1783232 RepID=UPI000833EF9B|nr:VOC family protein [Croceicoccus bisphenolivorans]
MQNSAGEPIWYELLTIDIDKAQGFYEAAAGWKINAPPPEMQSVDGYRFIQRRDGQATGGVMQLSKEMQSGGAKPKWNVYFAVDDVDAAAAKVAGLGGTVHMGPLDLEGVGRMAFAADPQGNTFYLMRGFSEGTSDVYARAYEEGKCGWNELMTSDLDGSLAFYKALLGYEVNETMDMGPEYGAYCFLDLGAMRLGAAMKAMAEVPTGWRFFFHVPDVEAAKEVVEANGGTVVMGPHDVPGGQRIIFAIDPLGAGFGLVAPQKAAPQK